MCFLFELKKIRFAADGTSLVLVGAFNVETSLVALFTAFKKRSNENGFNKSKVIDFID